MTPVHITMELLSPIELPKYPIHLDGLLFWAIKEETDSSDEEALQVLNTVLDKDGDVYKASSIRFIRSVEMPILDTDIAHPTRTHWDDWPFKVLENSKTITTKGGPFRKRMTTKSGLSAGQADFYAVGDAQKIKYLLETLGFIGLSNRQGFGEIGSVQVDVIEDDYSFFDENNQLARVLPVERVQDSSNEYLKIMNSFQPPYSSSTRTECCCPNFRILTK